MTHLASAALRLPDFALERYFARWEFAVRHNLCASDVEAPTLGELLALADDDARERWERLSLGYTESAGLPALREAIAARYTTIAAGDVLTFAGAEEAIFLAMLARLGPGDHAVVVVPAYQSLHEVARAAGAAVTTIALRAEQGWRLDIDAVRAALRPETRVVVVNYPHSPTGALLDRGAFEALVALTESRGITLFSDEVYRGLEVDENDRLPAAADLGEGTVSLGVLSKAYALPGLRIGWIATHDAALRGRIAALKDYTTICNSAPSEVLALIALRAADHLLARSRAITGANLVLLDEFFARHADRVAWVRPRAGSVAFPWLREGSADAFCATLVEQEGVLLLPGSLFGAEDRFFRIGFGRRDMAEGLQRVGTSLARSGTAQPVTAR